MGAANNIIQFPKAKKPTPEDLAPSCEEEIQEYINEIRGCHVNEGLTAIMPRIFKMLESGGFCDGDDVADASVAMIIESIRSFMLKRYDMKHPFQKLSESLFQVNESGLIVMADKIQVKTEDDDPTPPEAA